MSVGQWVALILAGLVTLAGFVWLTMAAIELVKRARRGDLTGDMSPAGRRRASFILSSALVLLIALASFPRAGAFLRSIIVVPFVWAVGAFGSIGDWLGRPLTSLTVGEFFAIIILIASVLVAVVSRTMSSRDRD